MMLPGRVPGQRRQRQVRGGRIPARKRAVSSAVTVSVARAGEANANNTAAITTNLNDENIFSADPARLRSRGGPPACGKWRKSRGLKA